VEVAAEEVVEVVAVGPGEPEQVKAVAVVVLAAQVAAQTANREPVTL